MPNRYKSNCATCQIAKADVSVRKRIRYAAYKREQGDETLQDIANKIGVSSPGIYNHVKKHMEDVSDRYIDRSRVQAAKKVAEVRAKVQQEAELVLEADVIDGIEARPLEIVALDDYIAQAKAMIDNKELKITAQSFLAATKIKSDWARGQQSGKIDLIKAMYSMAAGDKTKKKVIDGQSTTNSTPEDAGSDRTGENPSDSVYRTIAGDATP